MGGTEQIHYAISKAGVICLTKSFRQTFQNMELIQTVFLQV